MLNYIKYSSLLKFIFNNFPIIRNKLIQHFPLVLGISCLPQHPSDLCLFRFTLYLPHLKLEQPYHFDSASWYSNSIYIHSVFKLPVFIFFGLIIPKPSILVIFIAILMWKSQGVERFQNLHFQARFITQPYFLSLTNVFLLSTIVGNT